MALNNLGLALQEAHLIEEAISAHQDAAALYRETSSRVGRAEALNNLGLALRKAGRAREAITAHGDAAALYRQTGQRMAEAMAVNNRGLAWREAGQAGDGDRDHQAAVAVYREIGDRADEAMARMTSGWPCRRPNGPRTRSPITGRGRHHRETVIGPAKPWPEEPRPGPAEDRAG